MEKVVLSKKIEEAINGSKEAEEFLYNHYYECYYDLVEANQSIKNIELIYSESIRESIRKSIEKKVKNIPNYIRNTLFRTVKSYNDRQVIRKPKRTGINDLVISAKTDIESRGKLIERYMYLIDSYLENADFGADLTKEDAKQIGYLFLTEKVNNYFDSGAKTPLAVYLLVAFDQIYLNFLREKKEEVEEYHDKVTLAGLYLNKDTFEEENMEFEYCDFIDSTLEKDDIKEIFKSLTDSKEIRISKEQGISRQAVNKKIHKNKQKVKSFFDMK